MTQPAFHMPFTARTNPHLERTRRWLRQWAHRIGLLDPEYTTPWPEQWSERKFEEADFALWTAMTHPDIDADELNLVTGWHVALWFVDDLALPLFGRIDDRAAAQRQVDRLLEFLPVDALPRPLLVPRNPVERAFAELWPRTAPSMTPVWRLRFRGDVERFLRGVLREIDRPAHENGEGAGGRAADPIEYVQDRREFGGLPMTSTLMEHGQQEIPEHIYRLRSFQSALRAFADVISLHNDIVSYEREIAEGTVDNNGVEVLRRALGCDLQQATTALNAMLTGRVDTLRHMVGTELPRVLGDEHLPERLAARITGYLETLTTATAGSYAWHDLTGRFRQSAAPARTLVPHGPTGFGTSAARLARTASG
ncbi:terpene synthase family protein [Streptomyces clavuligerus]|nr:terpene synthase [Streptomyces clavuligerus]WDN56748.1 terpene synthase [Streptomyces clavuligerus]